MRTDADKMVEAVSLLKIIAKNNKIDVLDTNTDTDLHKIVMLSRAIAYGWSSVTL